MSRPTPDRADEGDDLLSRLISESGDPEIEPRREHVADLRALILDRLGPPRADRPSKARWLVASGMAAAGLLAVLAWPRGHDKGPIPAIYSRQPSEKIRTRPTGELAGIAAWRDVRRGLDVSEMPAFSWPLQGSSPHSASTSIPPDLLD